MRVICFTSDKSLWAVQAFAYQFNKYWDLYQPVMVAGYSRPEYMLPANFRFTSIGDFKYYPFDRWSNGVIEYLESVEDELFIWAQEDLWLLRQVDLEAIKLLELFMEQNPDVARMDLTADRANNAGIRDIGYWGHLDLVESYPDIPYHFSFQMAIWRRRMLLDCLARNENPNQAEIAGQLRLDRRGYRVLGTRQRPVRYLIAVQKGRLVLDGGYQGESFGIHGMDRRELERMGYLNGSK